MRGWYALLRTIAAFAVLASLTACNLPDRWILPSYDAYPTALDYWHEARVILAGSYEDGIIHALKHDGTPTSRPFLVPGTGGPRRALRIRVDNTRHRLWILDSDGVYVYGLSERRLIATIPLPHAPIDPRHCLPDIAVDERRGIAFVSNPARPILHVISPRADETSYDTHAIELRTSDGTQAEGLSALAILPGHDTLVAGSAASGHLWRVDPALSEIEPIALARGRTLAGVCAMNAAAIEAAHAHRLLRDHHVFLTTGLAGGVFRLHLTPSLRSANVKHVAASVEIDDPLGVVVMSGYLVVSGSQLGRHPDFGGRGDPSIPFRLAIMPAEHEPTGPIVAGR